MYMYSFHLLRQSLQLNLFGEAIYSAAGDFAMHELPQAYVITKLIVPHDG